MTLKERIEAGFARLVTAVNAVDTKVNAVVPGAAINDGATNGTQTWSSTKSQAQINAAVAALIGGADIANDTLNEIAARITANAVGDAGKLSFAAAQTLTTPEKLQACNNLGIGDPDFNFLTAINLALNAGL